MAETTTITCPACTGTGMESTDPEDASSCLLCSGSGGVEAADYAVAEARVAELFPEAVSS